MTDEFIYGVALLLLLVAALNVWGLLRGSGW